jgi:hypothetical protein
MIPNTSVSAGPPCFAVSGFSIHADVSVSDHCRSGFREEGGVQIL